MGIIFTILAAIGAYRLWNEQLALAIIIIIAGLYQLSTLSDMYRNTDSRGTVMMNLIASIIILGLFITSFIL